MIESFVSEFLGVLKEPKNVNFFDYPIVKLQIIFKKYY